MTAPRLIETLAWNGRAPLREGRHLARLARSAAALGYPCDPSAAARALRDGRTGPARLRLTLDAEGRIVRWVSAQRSRGPNRSSSPTASPSV